MLDAANATVVAYLVRPMPEQLRPVTEPRTRIVPLVEVRAGVMGKCRLTVLLQLVVTLMAVLENQHMVLHRILEADTPNQVADLPMPVGVHHMARQAQVTEMLHYLLVTTPKITIHQKAPILSMSKT